MCQGLLTEQWESFCGPRSRRISLPRAHVKVLSSVDVGCLGSKLVVPSLQMVKF